MAVYRVERTRDYTVMSNCHLKDTDLSLKAKGLLSMMLSLPNEWNYNTRGLAAICKEGVDAIGSAVRELEGRGYIVRRQLRGTDGRITDTEYTIYEQPQQPDPPALEQPDAPGPDTPHTENPYVAGPHPEMAAELNINTSSTKKENTKRCSDLSVRPSAGAPIVGQTDVTEKRAQIMEQIEYDRIATPANREQVDEFVELMLEVALTRSPTIHIGREQEYPAALVQQRFAMLERTHIEKVLDGINENATRAVNMTEYAGKEPEPVPEPVTEPEPEPERKGGMGSVLTVLLLADLVGGGVVCYLKFFKKKPDTRGSADLDDSMIMVIRMKRRKLIAKIRRRMCNGFPLVKLYSIMI